jgi:hypothetical protein
VGTVSKSTKSNGTTDLVDGDTIYADDLNDDFNTLFTLVNGDIDGNNIADSGIGNAKLASGIDAAKIDDHSDSTATSRLETDPGATGSQSLATTLEQELLRIRFMLNSIGHGQSAQYTDGSGTAAAYWGDRTARGPNLVRNAGFEVKTTGSTAAPDGWSLVGTPSSVTQVTTDVSNGTGKALRVVADAADEGISQTLAGLRASTNYLVVWRYKVTSGSVKLITTGADAATSFRNVSVTKTDTSWSVYSQIIATDSTPTDIVVKAQSAANADDFQLDDILVIEMSRYVRWRQGPITVRDSSTTAGALAATEGVFPAGDQLSAAVTVPGPGYTIKVRSLCRVKAGGAANNVCLKLYEDASAVDIAEIVLAGANYTGAVPLGYTNNNPTPGTTYTYTTQAIASSASGTANGTTNAGTETSLSWIEVDLVPPG